MDTGVLVLISITLFAAVVNGALGYGFSSITVPVALIFYTNRILNPALVPIEVLVNIYVLIMSRKSIPAVWRRVSPILLGLPPGILAGSYLLTLIHPGWVKLATFLILLPLILLQAAGVRRPIQSERAFGVPFGTGVGFLYSIMTVSGPPLALMFNNQGLVKQEFRAALGIIRVGESIITATAYYLLGLYTFQTGQILSFITPGVLIGIPVGACLIRQINPETFRRICMSFDVVVVALGLSRVLVDLKLVEKEIAYGFLAGVVLLDIYLLYAYFRAERSAAKPIL